MALDTRNADMAAWVVKVPHALATVWKAACDASMAGLVDESHEGPALLGRVVLEDGTPSFLELPDTMYAEGIPRRFQLQQMPLASGDENKMHVLSYEAPQPAVQQQLAAPGAAAGAGREISKPRVDGTVAQRIDMLPMTKDERGAWVLDAEYLKLVRSRTERAAEKVRTVSVYEDLSLDNKLADLAQHKRAVKDIHLRRKANEAAAREDNLKRPRLEKDELEEVLFRLFERSSAWHFKALVAETRQPHMHLKAVLEGIATQQKRGPNKDRYELKPEYRSRSRGAGGAAGGQAGA